MVMKSFATVLLTIGMVGSLAWAQPPDFAVYPGDKGPRHDRGREDRLERMVEYLDLSEAQASEWQAITEQQAESVRARWERIGSLREEFESLADQDAPNLENVGRVALDLHREMEAARSSRGAVFSNLHEILTPDQKERLDALRQAREFSSGRGPREERGPRNPPEVD